MCLVRVAAETVVDRLVKDLKWAPDPNNADDILWWDFVAAAIQRAPVTCYTTYAPYPGSYEQYLWLAHVWHICNGMSSDSRTRLTKLQSGRRTV